MSAKRIRRDGEDEGAVNRIDGRDVADDAADISATSNSPLREAECYQNVGKGGDARSVESGTATGPGLDQGGVVGTVAGPQRGDWPAHVYIPG